MQRYGQGPEDELPLEANGDYTREIWYLNFANYTTNISVMAAHMTTCSTIFGTKQRKFFALMALQKKGNMHFGSQ